MVSGYRTWRAWRHVDRVSLRGICPDTLSVPGELGLVSQHISRRGIVREQHLETDVRCSPCRRSHASRHPSFARDLQFRSQRVVSLGERSTPEPRHRHSAVDRLDQLSARHRSKPPRDLAQRLLSRRLDEQEFEDDLPQHGSQRHRLRTQIRYHEAHAVVYAEQRHAGPTTHRRLVVAGRYNAASAWRSQVGRELDGYLTSKVKGTCTSPTTALRPSRMTGANLKCGSA